MRISDLSSDVCSSDLPTLDIEGHLSPDVLRLFVLEADSLTTPGLMRLIGYLERNGLDASSYRLSLWRKLIAPLTVVAMMLFAVQIGRASCRERVCPYV